MNKKNNSHTQISGFFSYTMSDFIKTYFMIKNLDPSYRKIYKTYKILLIVNSIALFLTIIYYGLIILAKIIVTNPGLKHAFDKDIMNTVEIAINHGRITVIMIIVLMIIDIFIIFHPITRVKIMYDYFKKKYLYEDKYDVTVTEKYVNIYHPKEEKTFKWKTISKVYEYQEGFLFADNDNTIFLLIPKRTFLANNALDNIKLLMLKKGKEIIQLSQP